jgi:hypothetical protein
MGFGELALTYSKPRAATIQSLESTYLATMSKEDYMEVLDVGVK